MKNTVNMSPEGVMSATSSVLTTGEHQCACGTRFEFTMEWPEGLVQIGELNINGAHCPECSAMVKLPAARYWSSGYRLHSAPLE